MPIRHGAMLASRASIWPRDHFCRNTIAPRRSRPTTWNEFLPISMPIVAMVVIDFAGHGCAPLIASPSQHYAGEGQEHGRTIPLPELRNLPPGKYNAGIESEDGARADGGRHGAHDQ